MFYQIYNRFKKLKLINFQQILIQTSQNKLNKNQVPNISLVPVSTFPKENVPRLATNLVKHPV